jgi:hypothetical protein
MVDVSLGCVAIGFDGRPLFLGYGPLPESCFPEVGRPSESSDDKYLPPETSWEDGYADERSITFSLATILWESLAGLFPWELPLRARERDPIEEAMAWLERAPPAIGQLLERSTSSDRDARPRVSEFANELTRLREARGERGADMQAQLSQLVRSVFPVETEEETTAQEELDALTPELVQRLIGGEKVS